MKCALVLLPLLAAALLPLLSTLAIELEMAEMLHCWVLLFLVALGPILLLRSFKYVPPSCRQIVLDLRGRPPEIIGSGLHFIPSPWRYSLTPSQTAWKGFGRMPAPESRVLVDPAPTQVHTSDQIPGICDVSVECAVREWHAASIIRDGGSIKARGCAVINQWLSEQIGRQPAEDCTYGRLSKELNTEQALDELNALLAQSFTYLSAQRVTLDPDGIKLSPKWLEQREEIQRQRQLLSEKEKVLEKELQLARLEQSKQTEAHRFQLATDKERAVAEAELARLRLQNDLEESDRRAETELNHRKAVDLQESARMKQAIADGMTTEQYLRLALGRCQFETMSNSPGVKYLAVPPGLLGLALPSGQRDEATFVEVDGA